MNAITRNRRLKLIRLAIASQKGLTSISHSWSEYRPTLGVQRVKYRLYGCSILPPQLADLDALAKALLDSQAKVTIVVDAHQWRPVLDIVITTPRTLT